MSDIILSEQYKTAIELNQKIMITAQAAQQNLYDMCIMLKQMRDEKLYKELGYQNFEEYCENEVGMKRRNAYNYISAIEKVKNVQSIAQIGMTKLSLLASLSEAQQEEIQQTVTIEDTSVRELKEEIARLRNEKSSAEAHLKIAQQQLQSDNKDKQAEKKRADDLVKDLLDIKSKNRKLTHDLEEAREENRQLHSSMSCDQKTTDATIRQLDRMLSEADQEHANDLERQRKKYQAEINQLKEQLENQKNTMDTQTIRVPDISVALKPCFDSLSTALSALAEALSDVNDHSFVRDSEKIVDDYRWKIDDLFDDFDDKLNDIKGELT